VFDTTIAFTGRTDPQMWYRDDWPHKDTYINDARRERREIYNAAYRRWVWRVAYEQLIYSHLDTDALSSQPRYLLNTATMRVLAGEKDNYNWTNIDSASETIAHLMINTPGKMSTVLNTGHSIHNERPSFLAHEIIGWADPPI
jgi:pimeloyl-ACP methyl ester carboxylesterase